MRRFGVVQLLLVSVTILACGGRTIMQQPQVDVRVGFQGGEGTRVHLVSPIVDQRPSPKCSKGPEDLTGSKRVYLRAGTQLACSPLPVEWMETFLARGLESAGFELVGEDSASDPEVLQIRATVLMLEVEAMSQMQSVLAESDVHVRLDVTSGAGLDASRDFHVKSQSAGMSASGGTFQQVFGTAIARSVREMTAALVSLKNRFAHLESLPKGWHGTSNPRWVAHTHRGIHQ